MEGGVLFFGLLAILDQGSCFVVFIFYFPGSNIVLTILNKYSNLKQCMTNRYQTAMSVVCVGMSLLGWG